MPMDLLLTFIPLVLVGIVVGIFCGMLGIGGGTVMVPVLRLGVGLSAYAAAATSLFTMVFTSISGAVSHARQKTLVPLLGLCLGAGGCVTSALGVYLGSISPAWAIMLVAAAIILYSAQNMLRKALRMPKGGKRTATPDGAAAHAAADDGDDACDGKPPAPPAPPVTSLAEEGFRMTWKRALGGVGIGLVAGLAAGYVGVGGGFIMVPLMTAWLGVPMRKASGTSLIAIIILSVPGVVEQVMLGQVDFLVGIAMAVGSIPGAAIGAKLVKRIPERQLRLIFAAFLALAGIVLVVNEVAGA